MIWQKRHRLQVCSALPRSSAINDGQSDEMPFVPNLSATHTVLLIAETKP